MSNQTVLAIRDDQIKFDEWQEKALAHLGVAKAAPADLAVFFHQCKRTGLDPFAKQIYMIERKGKQTIQTGIDGFRLIAQRACRDNGEKLGYGDTQWCGPDGEWRDVWLESEPPRAAKLTVYRDREPFPGLAMYDEYVGTTRDGSVTQMWRTKPVLMLAKCAEALALRRAFPLDLSGVYTADEMHGEQREPQASVTAADFAPTNVDTITGEVHDLNVEDAEEVQS